MTDIPQEVREAARKLTHGPFCNAFGPTPMGCSCGLDDALHAMFLAGKRTGRVEGMERAAEIATNIYCDDDWLDRDDAANAIAQAIRSEANE